MKRYETYKDSGIQWLGVIPEHWKVCRTKNIVSLINEHALDSPLKKVALENIESGTGKYLETDSQYEGEGSLFHKDDILFGKLRPYLAKVYKAEFEGQSVGDIYVFRGKEGTNPDFLKYMFISDLFISVVDGSTYGAKMPRANWDFISNLKIAIPSLEEQTQIANYLDYTIGQADNLISAKEKQVEDLQQYRSSVISEAVTRGLNPDVEFKDSGVEWIGEIPKHWDVNLLKRYAEVYTGSTPSTSILDYWNNPTKNWYTPSDFSDDIHLFESDRKVSAKAYLDNACRVFPKDTVFVVGIGATLGKVGIVSSECSANQQINAIIFNDKVNPHYGAYYLYSKKDYMNAVANAATLPILNQSATKELAIVVPPFSEQQEIADYLDEKTSKIDETIKELKIQIDDLRQYKKSVISEAVTGKVDLRDWKPK